jgi:hypothetical protein
MQRASAERARSFTFGGGSRSPFLPVRLFRHLITAHMLLSGFISHL